MAERKGGVWENSAERPADLSWFTRSTARYWPLIGELMTIAIVARRCCITR